MVLEIAHLFVSSYSYLLFRTNGSVIFASGSPYKPLEFEGHRYEPGQGNNMYVFPGIGMGGILSKARHVTDSMVEQASIALAGSLTAEEKAAGLVYPRVVRIREISTRVALAVIRAAQKDVSACFRFGLEKRKADDFW
jgi:malate dehydrogenase (oxaloacetate-decarboxylating)(NADP+)